MVDLWPADGGGEQKAAVAAADVQHPRRGSAEQRVQVERRVDVVLDYVEDAGVIESGSAELTLRKNGTLERAALTLDVGARTLRLTSKDGTVLAEGGAEQAAAGLAESWLEAAGISATSDSW